MGSNHSNYIFDGYNLISNRTEIASQILDLMPPSALPKAAPPPPPDCPATVPPSFRYGDSYLSEMVTFYRILNRTGGELPRPDNEMPA